MKKNTRFLDNKEKLFFFFIIFLFIGRQLKIHITTISREVFAIMSENNFLLSNLFPFTKGIKKIKMNITRLVSNNRVLRIILLFIEEKNNTIILS